MSALSSPQQRSRRAERVERSRRAFPCSASRTILFADRDQRALAVFSQTAEPSLLREADFEHSIRSGHLFLFHDSSSFSCHNSREKAADSEDLAGLPGSRLTCSETNLQLDAPSPYNRFNALGDIRMLHLAVVTTAVFFSGWLVLNLFSAMFRHDARTPGCLSTIVVAFIALVAIILAFRI